MIKKDNTIYFLVPGFLGNFSEGLFKKIENLLLKHGKKIHKCSFAGHEKGELLLPTINEMLTIIQSNFKITREKNPSAEIVLIAHSQGCGLVSKIINIFDKKTKFFFLAPAINLDKLMLDRIPKKIIEKILRNESVLYEISKDKHKVLNKKMILSYIHFKINKKIIKENNKSIHIIRPKNDYIPKEDTLTILDNSKNIKYSEVNGDHCFRNKDAFIKKLFEIIMTGEANE